MKALDFDAAFDIAVEHFKLREEAKKLRRRESGKQSQSTPSAGMKRAGSLIQQEARRFGHMITPASKMAAATWHRHIIRVFREWLNRENGQINVSKFIRFIKEQSGLHRYHLGANGPRHITSGAIRWVLRTRLGIKGAAGRPTKERK